MREQQVTLHHNRDMDWPKVSQMWMRYPLHPKIVIPFWIKGGGYLLFERFRYTTDYYYAGVENEL
jgi:hypothetical protein